MCGRYTHRLSWSELRKLMTITTPPPETNLQPNYNVAPTHDVPVCTQHDGERRLEMMRWGLVPIWAKEWPKYSTFNAKCESVEEKATWKGSLNKMRCVIPASGVPLNPDAGPDQPAPLASEIWLLCRERSVAPVSVRCLGLFVNSFIRAETRTAPVRLRTVVFPIFAHGKLASRSWFYTALDQAEFLWFFRATPSGKYNPSLDLAVSKIEAEVFSIAHSLKG